MIPQKSYHAHLLVKLSIIIYSWQMETIFNMISICWEYIFIPGFINNGALYYN